MKSRSRKHSSSPGLVLGALLVVVLVGCTRTHDGPVKEERATVLQMAYAPATDSSGTGITSSGKVAFVSSYAPEVWAVVLRCHEHGRTFALRGKDLYDRCATGMVVRLRYVEILDDQEQVVDFRTLTVDRN